MEMPEHTSGLGWMGDLAGHVAQPGEDGWLAPWLRSIGTSSGSTTVPVSSSSSGSMLASVTSSGSTESAKPTSLPPQVLALLQASRSSAPEDPRCLSFEYRCAINLAMTYLSSPPPPAPARQIPSYKAPQYIMYANPGVVVEKSKRCAKVALEHYNKRKKIKFELLDVMPVIVIIESDCFYTHINFTLKSTKKDSKEQLFFAELYRCSKRRSASGYLVTCCEPLGSDATVGHDGFQIDGGKVRKKKDFTRCFACSTQMLHPRGDKYIAGHRNVPYIYHNTC